MSVLNPNSDEEPLECPLCMEFLELDDINFYPCSCGYQICRFCWNKIRTEGSGNCPACRSPYAENPADFKPLTREEMAKIKAEKRQKDQAKKQKISENRKHLANVRVVQKNLVFVVGLSPRLSDAEVLRKQDYFGKFGKIHKVVINTSTAYAGNQNQGPSASAYVTYYRSEDALRAIQAVNNIYIDGRTLKASLGTTKYCSHFMKNQPCPKPDCMYLHELGDDAASFTKEEMQQGKHTEYEKSLHEEMVLNQPSEGQQNQSNGHHPATSSENSRTNGTSDNDKKVISSTKAPATPPSASPAAATATSTTATTVDTSSSSSSGRGSLGNGSSRTPSPKTGSSAGSISSNSSSSAPWPNSVRNGLVNNTFRNSDSPDLVSQLTNSESSGVITTGQKLEGIRPDSDHLTPTLNTVAEVCDPGWESVSRTTSEYKDDLFGEDDLGFDPFHETQKALAEILESESQQGFGATSSPPLLTTTFSSSTQHTSSQQQFSSSSSSAPGVPPPGLAGLNSSSSTSSGRAKQPPPGFNMMNFSAGLHNPPVPNLLSQELHNFGGGLDSFSSANSSNHTSNGFGGHLVNGRDSDFGFGHSSMRMGLGRNHSGGSGAPHMQQSHTDRNRPDSGGGGNFDQLQQQFRQMAMEGKYSNPTKDWQDGFRALLPNINVSFGALPQQHQNGQQLPLHLLDGVMDSGSRFNNLQTSTSTSNLLNDLQSNNHLNNHMDRSQQLHHHQNMRQHNSGWHNMSGGNDWTVMDPAIVGGQLSDSQQQQRADSPPNWIKANLEQLTSDSGSHSGGGGSFNIGPLLPNAAFSNFSLSSPPPTSSSSGPGGVGLAGWTQPLLANTPPPGFSLNRTAAQLQQQQQQHQQQQQQQQLPFQNHGGHGPGAPAQPDLESEFQRLIHSK